MSRPVTHHGTAASVVGPYLGEQVGVILDVDRALRAGDETVIHAGRVATRRVRSTLRVFGPLFQTADAERLDDELRWWAGMLGPLRDLEVLRDRLDGLVAELDEELVVGPVRSRIEVELGHDRLEHWAAVVEALDGERHRALVDHLERWGAEPPWTATAGGSASTLPEAARRAGGKVAKRLRHAQRSGDAADLHRARRAAKRARYAAEVVAPLKGSGATKAARRYERLQELLGEHHDSTASAQLLRRLGSTADGTSGESGFTFGVLHEREQQRTAKTAREVRRLARHVLR